MPGCPSACAQSVHDHEAATHPNVVIPIHVSKCQFKCRRATVDSDFAQTLLGDPGANSSKNCENHIAGPYASFRKSPSSAQYLLRQPGNFGWRNSRRRRHITLTTRRPMLHPVSLPDLIPGNWNTFGQAHSDDKNLRDGSYCLI